MDLQEIQARLEGVSGKVKELGVKSLAVFGSTARGLVPAPRDIDFLVEFEGPATFDAYMSLKELLEDLFGMPIDLVTRKGIKPALRGAILHEAIRVA